MAYDDHPLAFVGKFLNSTGFLSSVLVAIACLVGWVFLAKH